MAQKRSQITQPPTRSCLATSTTSSWRELFRVRHGRISTSKFFMIALHFTPRRPDQMRADQVQISDHNRPATRLQRVYLTCPFLAFRPVPFWPFRIGQIYRSRPPSGSRRQIKSLYPRFQSGPTAFCLIGSNNPNRVPTQNWVTRDERQPLAQRLCNQDAVKRIPVAGIRRHHYSRRGDPRTDVQG